VTGRWLALVTPVSSTNKAHHHDITEILLKVALNTTIPTPPTPMLKVMKNPTFKIAVI
jgi:hypothetical protein